MQPIFDQVLAASYLGKHLLVGITYVDENSNVIEQKQLHGLIARINLEEGIVVSLPNSEEEFKLPPDLSGIEPAPPGEYQLRSTDEVVTDPDFLTRWTFQKPASQGT